MSKDAKFWGVPGAVNNKRGEVAEIKEGLYSTKEDRKKDSVKKVIADMTIGKDVSMLFNDVVQAINTQNIELKKLIYLYVMNYAKSQPELAILAVGSFVKDTESPNPLIRALALRTMGCIRINGIADYLAEPLRKALKDSDPYVRKTAAICVAKLFDINPELVTVKGYLDGLRELLADSNPIVVGNAVAALTEIDEASKKDVFKINANNLNSLMAALNECTEWGQVFILNALSHYFPRDSKEAEMTAERVTPRLQHANSAVVLAAVKVIMKNLELIQNPESVKSLCKRMAPPLVTLVSSHPEIQFVALRNINLIVQKLPNLLQRDVKVFFCKYNDPIFVKLEKLELMIMLCSDESIDQVLAEFKEYATEIDVEFVRKSVRAIGRLAIKLEVAAERCVQALLDLIQTKVNYVVQEVIIVVKDIFRKYPNKYEKIISTLCENLESLDEPEAKASMIWIVGQYAERIDNANELIESFIEGFKDESSQVQLQLLTATVKLFLKKPKDNQRLVQSVLDQATLECDNPDLRDRGFVYWRLLSADPEAAKAVVLAEKPLITEDSALLEPSLLDELITNIATLSSVYHKLPETFVSKYKSHKAFVRAEGYNEEEGFLSGGGGGGGFDLTEMGSELNQIGGAPGAGGPRPTGGPQGGAPYPAGGGAAGAGGAGPVSDAPKVVWLPPDQGKGLQVLGSFVRRDGRVVAELNLQNFLTVPMSQFGIQFNKNSFGLLPTTTVLAIPQLMPGESINYVLPLATGGEVSQGPPSTILQVAFKNNFEIFYFQAELPFNVLFQEDGRLDKQSYLQIWQSIPDQNERVGEYSLKLMDVESLTKKLDSFRVFFVAKRQVNNQEFIYLSLKVIGGILMLLEVTLTPGVPSCKCALRTNQVDLVPLIDIWIRFIFNA